MTIGRSGEGGAAGRERGGGGVRSKEEISEGRRHVSTEGLEEKGWKRTRMIRSSEPVAKSLPSGLKEVLLT